MVEIFNTKRPSSQHSSSWRTGPSATTSRSALYRANTATFENVFRLPSFNRSAQNSPIKCEDGGLRGGLNRTNSSVFQRALSFSNNNAVSDVLQRSNTFVLNRHTMMKRTDTEDHWNVETEDQTINGKDLELVGENAVRLFYLSDWSPAVLHYSTDRESTWTQPPGLMMTEATGRDLPDLCPDKGEAPDNFRLWVTTIENAPEGIVFVPNDNGKRWDKALNDQNYVIDRPGTYFLKNGHLTRLSLPPGRPIILVEKRIEVQQIELSWNPPIDGESDVAGYKIYRDGRQVGTLRMEEVLRIEQNNDEGTDTVMCFEGYRNFSDCGLMGSTKYRYEVTAFNDEGVEGEPSSALVVRTAEPDRPGAIENFWINRTSTEQIDLTWAAPLDTGGGVVDGYRVFRNGAAIGIVPATSDGVHHFSDRDVQPGGVYMYHVTTGLAIEALKDTTKHLSPSGIGSDEEEDVSSPKGLPATLSVHAILNTIEGERWIQSIEKLISEDQRKREGPHSQGKLAEARNQAPLPRLFEKRSHILLQSFNWRSCHNKTSWYQILGDKVSMMNNAGITMLWLPPPSQSVAPQGYMPSELYNLDSAYGSEEMLRKLIRSCQDQDISPIVDFVANHRCGSKQDDLGQWTIFENPEWGPWAIVSNNKQGYRGVSNEQDSGAQSDCAPDINHNNQQVQKDYKKWLGWLFNDVGFKGIRVDMAPGYGINHQLNYLNSVGNPLTIGEYWSGDINTLKNYIYKAQRKISVYDFAFYYVLRRCVEGGDYGEMRNHQGQLNGLVGQEPGLSVTFLDNHDTEHLDFVGRFANGDSRRILIGYAILLTHPGIPSIYWNHFSDYGRDMTDKLTLLGQLRKEAFIISTSKISIHMAQWDGYVAYITGEPDSTGRVRSLCVKIGNANGFHPSQGWQHRAHGDGWNVWMK